MNKLFALTAISTLAVSSTAVAQIDHAAMGHSHHAHHGHHHDHANHHSRPDAHGPASIMGDHVHEKGKFMLSYRFMRMNMSGMMDGSDGVDTGEVTSSFMASPTKMTMDMHMFGAMYGVTDKFTVMTMLPYIDNKMEHINAAGNYFNRHSSGYGDVKLSGLYQVMQKDNHGVIVGMGISLPTGSIDERDPAGNRLPYPMQIGSGTYDFLPSVTYTGHNDAYSWGAQAKATIRTGENNNNYRLGDVYKANMWGAKKMNDRVSVSARLGAMTRGDIDGADPELNRNMVPTARAENYGRDTVDVGLGVNFAAQSENWNGNRLQLELSAPVYQDVNGQQLGTDWTLSAAWKVSF